MVEPFFFPSTGGIRLFGVWRQPASAPRRVWVVCPPFAEEEKSARRTLTETTQFLVARGDATLLFSFRGAGDSEGNFAATTLTAWREDLQAAVAEARRRAPEAEIALLGLRLGASLALQESEAASATSLVLIEPLLNGRSFVVQMSARKKMRAQLTGGGAEAAPTAPTDYEDMDGWALSTAMKAELSALDLNKWTGAAPEKTLLLQVGPKPELTPPNQALATKLAAQSAAVVMPPFWNLLDYAPAKPLLEALEAAGD